MARIVRSPTLAAWVLLSLAGCQACGAASPTESSRETRLTSAGASCVYVEKAAGPPGAVPIRIEVVAKGLDVPWGIAFLPSGDMLVTERPGKVVRVDMRGTVSPAVAEPDTSAAAEGGLLGIALSPRFVEDRLFYVYVTGSKGGNDENRIERWKLGDDEKSATLDKVVVSGIAAAKYHDGGRIRFGKDGMLYVGTGDGREPERSQDEASLNGKILRLTPDGAIPADNPISGRAAYVTGVRNSQGFDWLSDGSLAITDHGPSGEINGWSGHDEVTVAKPGENLGWPKVHGCDALEGARAPSLTWKEASPPGGAAVYTGDAIPEWKGALAIGSLKSEHLHLVYFDEKDPRGPIRKHEVYLAGDQGRGRLRETIMGPDGNLYVTTSNCDGRGTCGPDKDVILRITR
jgi:aldose sugar dehydrogenase